MIDPAEVHDLVRSIRERNIDLKRVQDPTSHADIMGELGDVVFEARSSCGRVGVWMQMNGTLDDVVMLEDTMDRVGLEQLESIVLGTIGKAEQMARQALKAAQQ